MANGLLSAERRHRLTAAQRAAFVEEMLKLPIEVEPRAVRAILETQIPRRRPGQGSVLRVCE
jgi:hypothetical protein